MKINFSRALNVLIIVGVTLTLVLGFREVTWYSTKYYPNPVVYRGSMQQTPTLRDLEQSLLEIKPNEYVYPQARKVLSQTKYYRALLNAYLNKTLSERTIDFIGEIHQHPMMVMDSELVQVHRNRVNRFLLRSPARAFGIEGHYSESLTPDTLLAEFNVFLSRTGQQADSSMVDYAIEKSPLLSVGFSSQSNVVVGLEDKDLHDFTIVLIEAMTYVTDKKLRLKYEQLFKTLTFLRTEIAVARMNKVMRQQGIRFGVIVQGDLHRYQFLKLKELYNIPGKVESTIPEKDQEPITVLDFVSQW